MGEVEDLVVKGEEGKKGFFCPALIPNKKYNSLRCRFVSDFFSWMFMWPHMAYLCRMRQSVSSYYYFNYYQPRWIERVNFSRSFRCCVLSWEELRHRNGLSLNSILKKKRKKEKEKKQLINQSINNFIVHSYVWSRVNLFIASSTLHGYGNRMTAQWIHSAMASQPTSPAMRSRTVLRTINTEYGVSTEYRPHS